MALNLMGQHSKSSFISFMRVWLLWSEPPASRPLHAQVGTPVCVPTKDGIDLGRITSMELNHKAVRMRDGISRAGEVGERGRERDRDRERERDQVTNQV